MLSRSHGQSWAMTAALDIRRAQLKAIAAAAKESGCVVEVERDGTIYRIIPDDARDAKPRPVDFPEEIDL